MNSAQSETKIKISALPAWNALDIARTVRDLKTNPDKGLSEKEILQRQQVWGKNELPKGKRTTALQMFVRQFKSPLVYILLFAAVLTWWIGEYADMIVILVVVFANAIVGLFQEYRANKIFEKLKEAIR